MSELLDQLIPKGSNPNTSFGTSMYNYFKGLSEPTPLNDFIISDNPWPKNSHVKNHTQLRQDYLTPLVPESLSQAVSQGWGASTLAPPSIANFNTAPQSSIGGNNPANMSMQGIFNPSVQGMAPQSVSVSQGNTASMNTGFSPVTSITPQSNITGNNPANLSMQGWGNYNEPTQMRGIGNGSVGAGNGPATPPPTPGLWDTIGGMEGIAQGLGALGGIGKTALGFQQLGLAEDQFSFTKNAWQQDYNMRLEDYNRKVSRQDQKDAAFARRATT